MYKSAIFTVLAACAALVAANEPESTTTLTSTSTVTKTITLTNCGPDVPECTYVPEPTPTPEPSTTEEPESSTFTFSNATISATHSTSKPVVVVTDTSFADSVPEPTEAAPSVPAPGAAGSVSVHGGLLVAAVLGFLALN